MQKTKHRAIVVSGRIRNLPACFNLQDHLGFSYATQYTYAS